jgi:hypothetical protein
MLAEVEEHVNKAPAYLARCGQRVGVVAVVPDRAPASAGAIDRAGTSNGEALQSAGEGERSVGFGNEVEVVGLDGEVDQAEAAAAGGGEGPLEGGEHGWRPKRREAGAGAERDVGGVSGGVLGAWSVRGTGAWKGGFAACSPAGTSPGTRGGEGELLRPARWHLDLAAKLSTEVRRSCGWDRRT